MGANYLKNILIKKQKEPFSETEKKIAEYFNKFGDNIINMTLSNLAEEIGTSETSVYKFVKKLDFDGFQDFKISVATHSTGTTEESKRLTAFTDITSEDSPFVIAQKVINSNQSALDKLLLSFEEQDLKNALNLLQSAKTIHFFGQGASSIVAYDSYHKFHRSHFLCNYIADSHMQMTYSTKLGPTDCVFLFSHSGNTKETIKIAEILSNNGVKIISMTGNPLSKLVELSDVSFVIYSEEYVFGSEVLTARFLYLTIVDILYINILYGNEEENKKSLEEIRKVIATTRYPN